MRYILRYILFAILAGALISCALEEPFEPIQNAQQYSEVEFVARPVNYIYTDVSTRAVQDDMEKSIYSAFFLVYDTEGTLIRYENITSQIESGVVPSQKMTSEKGLTDITVCYLANFPESFVQSNMKAGDDDGDITDWEKLQSTVIEFKTTDTDLNEFRYISPDDANYVGTTRIDVHDDGRNTPNPACIPMFGYWQGDLNGPSTSQVVDIVVQRLFAKIGFTINLQLQTPPATLELQSIKVNNIPRFVHLFPQEEESSLINASSSNFLSATQYATIPDAEVAIDNNGSATFYFYVPEYIVFPIQNTIDAYKEINHYKEQYKPKFIGEYNATRKKATNVQFTAKLTTQGQDLEIDYTIYLGGNEIDDFTIKRNYFYDNQITIRGVSEGSGAIGVDHRVNVRYDGFLVAFQRATLLDSHFEVRPLRVKFAPEYITENNKKTGDLKDGVLTVQVLHSELDILTDTENWIRLERPHTNTTNSAYCLTGNKSYNHTKRRYFTTDLVTNTLKESGKVISYNPFASSSADVQGDLTGDIPIWVYIDEYSASSTNAYDAEGYRTARIRVSYQPNDPDSPTITHDFTVQQRAIYPVRSVQSGSSSKVYGIEYFEEYLHDYDALKPDGSSYGEVGGEYVTDYSGIEWGLNGVQLSYQYPAAHLGEVHAMTSNEYVQMAIDFFNETVTEIIDNQVQEQETVAKYYYDFYLGRDPQGVSAEVRNYNGINFNKEIINRIKSQGISDLKMPLNGTASSVVEYCLNKNKRNADGSVSTIYWYAPSIDEIEDIVTSAYNEFTVFQDMYYWSCQPAYNINAIVVDRYKLSVYFREKKSSTTERFLEDAYFIGEGSYLTDNIYRARATKVDANGNNISSGVSGDDVNYQHMYITGAYDSYVTLPYTNKFLGVWLPNPLGITITGSAKNVGAEIVYNDDNDITYDAGNFPRVGTEDEEVKNRVRCIYYPGGMAL